LLRSNYLLTEGMNPDAPPLNGTARRGFWRSTFSALRVPNAFQGTTPIGGPLIGWIIAAASPRIGLVVGGASCLVAVTGGTYLSSRYRRRAQQPHVLRTTSGSPPDRVGRTTLV
jgi:hypothetical protein